jgi:hypothetical protein
MSQSFRITVNNQDYFFRILSPVNINNQTAEIKVEIDKDAVVSIRKVAETWQEGIEQFPKKEVIQAILKAICLRFRI